MKYTPAQVETLFNQVIAEVETGKSLNQLLSKNGMPSRTAFYDWLEKDPSKAEKYARAKDASADALFEQMIEISKTPIESETIDDGPNGVRVIKSDNVARSRLMLDALKWVLAKQAPKKYGDKIDVTSGNEAIAIPAIIGMAIKNELKADEPEDFNDLL